MKKILFLLSICAVLFCSCNTHTDADFDTMIKLSNMVGQSDISDKLEGLGYKFDGSEFDEGTKDYYYVYNCSVDMAGDSITYTEGQEYSMVSVSVDPSTHQVFSITIYISNEQQHDKFLSDAKAAGFAFVDRGPIGRTIYDGYSRGSSILLFGPKEKGSYEITYLPNGIGDTDDEEYDEEYDDIAADSIW